MKRRTVYLLLTLFVFATDSRADVNVLRVEEDWEMQVGNPKTARSAPQATMLMSPTNSIDNNFMLTINHKTHPEYQAGGLQVQVWNDQNLVSAHNGPQGNCLDHSDELLRWTQRMQIISGSISFEIVDGTSESWGSFGGQGYLKASMPTSLSKLNTYRHQVSVSESGIGFAGNRVASLRLVRVRWYLDNGKVYELPGDADVDSDLDPWTDSAATSSSWEVNDL